METIILFAVFIIQAFCSGFFLHYWMEEYSDENYIAYGLTSIILLAGVPLLLISVVLILLYKVLNYFQLIFLFKHVVLRVPLNYENIHTCREILTKWIDDNRYSKWYDIRGKMIYHLSLWTHYKYMVWLANNK